MDDLPGCSIEARARDARRHRFGESRFEATLPCLISSDDGTFTIPLLRRRGASQFRVREFAFAVDNTDALRCSP